MGRRFTDPKHYRTGVAIHSQVFNTEVRDNFKNLDTRAAVPGSVVAWPNVDAIPNGWLKCDGREVSRARFPELFAAIGERYGEGDGATTFALPDPGEPLPVPVTAQSSTTVSGVSNTSYDVPSSSDDMVGVAFTAPPDGIVVVHWHARIENNNSGGGTLVSVGVREGAILGSGTDHTTASDSFAIENSRSGAGNSSRHGAGTFRVITGLTPGDFYNAVVEHRITTGTTGDLFSRAIYVERAGTAGAFIIRAEA